VRAVVRAAGAALLVAAAAPSPSQRFDAVFRADSIEIKGLRAHPDTFDDFDSFDSLIVNRHDRTLSRNITSCEINQAPADVAVIYDLKAPMSDRVTCSSRHSITHEVIDVTAEFTSRVVVSGDVLSFISDWTTDERAKGSWSAKGPVRWLTTGSSRIVLRIAGSRCELLDYRNEAKEIITNPGSSDAPDVTTVATDKTQAATCALAK
jgi:hypothetical protein